MTQSSVGEPFESIYEDRIGTTSNANEVTGYLVFLAGVVVGILGLAVYFMTDAATMERGVGYALGALAPALLMGGAVLRFPLRKLATYLTGAGLVITLAAVAWFLIIFPDGWSTTTGHTGVTIGYTLGLAIIGIAAVAVPLERTPRLSDTDVDDTNADESGLQAELEQAKIAQREARRARTAQEEAQQEAQQARADLADIKDALEETEADEADIAAKHEAQQASQSQYELYEDKAGQWRWRLRHRNGNIIADGSQGYTRKHNAQNGMQAVRRDALGASVLLVGTEDDLAEEGTDDGFVVSDGSESQAEFEIYEDADEKYRWRLNHDDGNSIASSGVGYASQASVQRAIDHIKAYVGPAEYLEADPRAIEIYLDEANEWRWRLVHRNGDILAASSEGYAERTDASLAIDTIREAIDDMELAVYEDSAGEFRWRMLDEHGELQAESVEGFASRAGAEESVADIQAYMPEADLLEIGEAVFEVNEDEGDEWRWLLRHRNGQVLAVSGEGFSDRTSAWAAIERVKRDTPTAALTAS